MTGTCSSREAQSRALKYVFLLLISYPLSDRALIAEISWNGAVRLDPSYRTLGLVEKLDIEKLQVSRKELRNVSSFEHLIHKKNEGWVHNTFRELRKLMLKR